MGRIKCGWKKLLLVFFVGGGILLASSCNNQVCPAYAKSEKAPLKSNV
jgi:hypothetical protein